MSNTSVQKRNNNVFYGLLYICITLMLLFRSVYSFCQSDESFYVALVHRLWLGEALIVDEWHPTQFYAPLLLPFYAVYKLIIPSGDGVILYFRILYVLAASAASWWLYRTLIRFGYSSISSFICGLFCMLYSRANIQGCSYYNLCLLFVILSLIITFQSTMKKYSCLSGGIIAGILLSCAVLCNPYLALIIVPLTIGMLACPCSRHLGMPIVLGIALSSACYLIFLFSRMSIGEFAENIPYLFNDPQHQSSLLKKISSLWNQSRKIGSIWNIITVGAMVVIVVFHRLIRRIVGFPIWLIYIGITTALLFQTARLADNSIVHVILAPLALSLFPCVVCCLIWKHSLLPVVTYAAGVSLSFAFFVGSNTGLDAMTSGFCLCAIGGVLMLEHILQDCLHMKNNPHCIRNSCVNGGVILLLCIPVIMTMASQRMIGVYRDAPISQLDTVIECGPARGLVTTQEHNEVYTSVWKTIHSVSLEKPEGEVIFVKWLPWAYIAANWNYGTVAPWNIDFVDSRLEDYYMLHLEKKPDLVFICADQVASWEYAPYNNHTASKNPNRVTREGWLYEQVNSQGVLIEQTPYLQVYMMNWNE